MQQIIEQHIRLPRASVLLANIEWDSLESFHPTVPGYYVTQRLSENHAPLRFAYPSIAEAFSSVRAVGVLPSTFSVSVLPPESAFRGLSCVYEDDYFEAITGLASQSWYERHAELLELPPGPITELMQRIHCELRAPGLAAELLIESASNLLLVELARYLRPGESASVPGRAAPRGGLASWQLRRVRERLEAASELGYPTVRELAQLCSISDSHLMRAFRKSSGTSLHQYVTRQRLEAARALLRDSEMPVSQVASRLGFSTSAYFSSAFRRVCGISPSQYRRRVRSGETT